MQPKHKMVKRSGAKLNKSQSKKSIKHTKSHRHKPTTTLSRSIATINSNNTTNNTNHTNNGQKNEHFQQRNFSTFDLDAHFDPSAAVNGPEPAAVRSVLRQLLRNTNPRIQSMKPRRSMRLSHGFQTILNEYRTKSNCSIVDAWKFHSTASQLVQALKANTYNANTLYQSGWKPARPQKQQVENVAKHIGMGLNTTVDELDAILNPTPTNLEDMLLFSNKNKIRVDPRTDAQQTLNEDKAMFHDIFGGDSEPVSIESALTGAKVDTEGISDELQRALFEDLGFNEVTETKKTPTGPVMETKNDLHGFPIKYNPTKIRHSGLNGWEISENKLSDVYLAERGSFGWDSATTYATGELSFARSFITQRTNTVQHNENVYDLGLLGCLMNDVENIAIPQTFAASFMGVDNIDKYQEM